MSVVALKNSGKFLSTLSLRRATPFFVRHILGVCISIHALLAESDCSHCQRSFHCVGFLSTLSLRRATRYVSHMGSFAKISIHALLAESDFTLRHAEEVTCLISIHALLAESDR